MNINEQEELIPKSVYMPWSLGLLFILFMVVTKAGYELLVHGYYIQNDIMKFYLAIGGLFLGVGMIRMLDVTAWSLRLIKRELTK